MNQLAAMKITFDDELQALLLLSSLPETLQEIHSLPTENSVGNMNNSVGN